MKRYRSDLGTRRSGKGQKGSTNRIGTGRQKKQKRALCAIWAEFRPAPGGQAGTAGGEKAGRAWTGYQKKWGTRADF